MLSRTRGWIEILRPTVISLLTCVDALDTAYRTLGWGKHHLGRGGEPSVPGSDTGPLSTQVYVLTSDRGMRPGPVTAHRDA